MNKYKAERTIVDGISFASQKEAHRYQELTWAVKAGECLWFICQAPFRLTGGIKYLADFLVVWKDGTITVEDTKGFRTPTYKIKRRQVEALYPIKIVEIV